MRPNDQIPRLRVGLQSTRLRPAGSGRCAGMSVSSINSRARAPKSRRQGRCWNCRTSLRCSTSCSSRGMRRQQLTWPLHSTVCCNRSASRSCWRAWGRCATRLRRRSATPGITRGSRRREPASSNRRPADSCARRSTARSSCSSVPGRQASRRIPAYPGVSRRRFRFGDGPHHPGPRVADGWRLGTGLAAAGRGPPAFRDLRGRSAQVS